MYFKDIPEKELEWLNKLTHGDPFIEDHVTDKLLLATDMTEFKHDIISQMTIIMAECAEVINHANELEKPIECTCDGDCGDKE